MSPWLLLTLAIAPGLFWLWYFYHRDRLEPEPRELVFKVFIWGAFAVIPVALLEHHVPAFYVIVLGAPVIEEFGKFAVVYWGVFRSRDFDEPMDGIVYATAAALGFATVENIGYVLGAAGSAAVGVSVVRAVLSVPGHALWACLWGYGLGRLKFMDRSDGEPILASGLALAMLSHSLFNLGIEAKDWSPWLMLLPPLVILVDWRLVDRRIRDAIRRTPLDAQHVPPGLSGHHLPPAPVPPPPPLHVPPPPVHEPPEPPAPSGSDGP